MKSISIVVILTCLQLFLASWVFGANPAQVTCTDDRRPVDGPLVTLTLTANSKGAYDLALGFSGRSSSETTLSLDLICTFSKLDQRVLFCKKESNSGSGESSFTTVKRTESSLLDGDYLVANPGNVLPASGGVSPGIGHFVHEIRDRLEESLQVTIHSPEVDALPHGSLAADYTDRAFELKNCRVYLAHPSHRP